jgi:hypothetical protein
MENNLCKNNWEYAVCLQVHATKILTNILQYPYEYKNLHVVSFLWCTKLFNSIYLDATSTVTHQSNQESFRSLSEGTCDTPTFFVATTWPMICGCQSWILGSRLTAPCHRNEDCMFQFWCLCNYSQYVAQCFYGSFQILVTEFLKRFCLNI